MSTFGSPGGRQQISKPIPPQRGSFPLDHDAECQPIMKDYLKCLKLHRGVNENECRMLSKMYLGCRMEKNLMAPDEMKNLGYPDEAAARADLLGEGPKAAAKAGSGVGVGAGDKGK